MRHYLHATVRGGGRRGGTCAGLKGVRGRLEEVRVSGGGEMLVADLLRSLRAQLAAEGSAVAAPSEAELYAGDTALPALANYPFAPELCLTLVCGTTSDSDNRATRTGCNSDTCASRDSGLG